MARSPFIAVKATRALLDAAAAMSLSEQLDLEMEAFVSGAGEADFAEALEAFASLRPARFTLRRGSPDLGGEA